MTHSVNWGILETAACMCQEVARDTVNLTPTCLDGAPLLAMAVVICDSGCQTGASCVSSMARRNGDAHNKLSSVITFGVAACPRLLGGANTFLVLDAM